MKCPACGGKAKKCRHCKSGEIEITRCPLEFVTDDIFELIEMARHTYQGVWPMGPAIGDNAVMFIRAVRFIRGEEDFWKSKLKIIG